ncbi:MAG: phosphate acetyltransferase [Bacteroidetes bacterium]|nr:MAG: phosphate acetyltransferase [Bacteroidota bacterium]RLD73232.1 MAG: phosphate acetyltransferase [Bacteroidota bacterium]RLD87137.1 MAG: phosphate acetyltransferase [Bacteroidota bacterium]
MSKNLYIAASEAEAGKSLIVLGMMNYISRHVTKVGFFRPFVKSADTWDDHIRLIHERFHLDFEYEEMYGMCNEEINRLIKEGDDDSIQTIILNKYKNLERKCDFVLIEGSDFKSHMSSYEFDFNIRVANNVGSPVVAVITGNDKNVVEVVNSVGLMKEMLAREGCTQLGTIVNRAKKRDVTSIKTLLDKDGKDSELNFVIPELDVLQKVSIRQIFDQLEAELIYGDDDHLNFLVSDIKIAAMGLENVLKNISGGDLIVTPADRLDILTALSLTLISGNFPKISGLVLTGNIPANKEYMLLLKGLQQLPIIILKVACDTFTTAMRIDSIHPELMPENEQRIALALGHFEDYVDSKLLTEKVTIERSGVVTPLMFEYELFERARAARKHIVLPEGTDERVLKAADILLRRNVVDITLLGNEDEIRKKASEFRLNIDDAGIIDPYDNDLTREYASIYYKLRQHKGITKETAIDLMHDVSYLGTMMVYKGHADGMVSGATHTTQHTIRPAFEFVKTKPGVSIVSGAFFMCMKDRVLVYADCAVNPNPNSEQLADIAISSAETAMKFGIEPRIAMLSYSTGDSGKGTDVEKVRKATEIVRQQRPDLKTEGPIQYDAAIDISVARTKMPDSEVAGKATIFIFPDLNTGNNTYKAVQRSANAIAIGPVLQGLNKPVNDLSRGCLVKDIVNLVVITAIQAQDHA